MGRPAASVLERGRRGLVRVPRIGPQLFFDGFLPDYEIVTLRRIGLLPPA